MNVDHFTLNTGSTGGILRATMNRYRPGTTQRRSHDRGCILLFAHGAGFRSSLALISVWITSLNVKLDKEHWEPTIKRIFENDRANQGPTRILEAWAIDCQNHGEAASLNDGILLQKPKILSMDTFLVIMVAILSPPINSNTPLRGGLCRAVPIWPPW
jgi:hypothetical protein